MPIYQFRCRECDKEIDVMCRIADLEKRRWCEVCGGQMQNVPAQVSKFVRGKGNWSSPA